MRTAGMLLMDTPIPDGRLMVRPQDFIGGSVSSGAGVTQLIVTGAATQVVGNVPGALLRYGMSDDAQQYFGKGSPSGGFQGAQAQPVTTNTPFTTPYGLSGRPPYPSAEVLRVPTSTNWRPKGLKPTAVTVVYAVSGGPMTSASVVLSKVNFTAGVAPAITLISPQANLPLGNAVLNVITTPIPVANQAFINDYFDAITVLINVNAGAATMAITGAFIDFAFNYN